MAINSKHFYATTKNLKCYHMLHSNKSCFEFCLNNITNNLKGSLKYYFTPQLVRII